MCEWNNGGIAVDLPDNMRDLKESGTVCIDECIVPQIQALWKAGVMTRGCCCGHGKTNPEVIIADSQDPTATARAYDVLKEVDSRRWSILQWKLVEVAAVPARE